MFLPTVLCLFKLLYLPINKIAYASSNRYLSSSIDKNQKLHLFTLKKGFYTRTNI